jgi:hypothetical protein
MFQNVKKGFKGIQNAIVGNKTTNYGFTLLKSDIKKCKLDDNETSLVVDGQKLKQIIIGSYVFDLSHNYIPGNYPTLEQVKADAVLDTIKNLVNVKKWLKQNNIWVGGSNNLNEESANAVIVEKSAKEATEANDVNVAKKAAEKAAAKAKEVAASVKLSTEPVATEPATEPATALVTVPATEVATLNCPSADIGINDITNESCKNKKELLLKLHPDKNSGCNDESTEKMKKFNELCSNKPDEIEINDNNIKEIKNGGKKLRKSKSKKGGKRRKTARARK